MAGRGSPKGVRQGGRTKGVPNKVNRDIKALADVYTDEALTTLAHIMRHGEADQARVSDEGEGFTYP